MGNKKEANGILIEVHKCLGPGLLESAYQHCLAHELMLRKIPFEIEKPLPVAYKGFQMDCGYRLDLVVDGKVIVEVKSVQSLQPIHEAQVLTYLKLSGLKVGLLMNFNMMVLKNGIRRLAL